MSISTLEGYLENLLSGFLSVGFQNVVKIPQKGSNEARVPLRLGLSWCLPGSASPNLLN